MCLNCTRFYCSLEYVKLWEEAQDEQSNTLDGSQGMKLFIIICVCVYFLFLGLQYACPSIYFYWKALLFRKLQLCKYYLWKNGWKQLQSIFMKRKWNILWHEVLGFLVNEETSQLNFAQTCCLISNSSSFILYFFLNYACTSEALCNWHTC